MAILHLELAGNVRVRLVNTKLRIGNTEVCTETLKGKAFRIGNAEITGNLTYALASLDLELARPKYVLASRSRSQTPKFLKEDPVPWWHCSVGRAGGGEASPI